jgi:Major Facilitator Superfamily
MSVSSPIGSRDEWRRHWRAVAGAGICVATGYGVFPFVASQFVQPLQSSLGWSRGAQSLTQNAAFVAAFVAPLFGRAVDKFGARRIGLFFMPALGVVYGLLAAMHGPIEVYYILMGAAVFFGLGTTGIVFMRAVSTHFTRSLGLALAVSRSAIAIAAAFLPIVIFQTIRDFGWRGGYAMLGAVALLVGTPACVLWVREQPSLRAAPVTRRPWRELLLNGKVLILCEAIALTIGPVVGLLSQLQPLLTGKGIVAGTAAVLGSVLAVSVLAGTLLTGWLVDRVWAPLVGCAFLLAAACGCVLLLPHSLSLTRATWAVALVGITQGAELDLAGYLIARYFGVVDFATIFGLTILTIGLASASSQMAFASLFDHFGGYDLPLQFSIVAFTLAGGGFLALGRYPVR